MALGASPQSLSGRDLEALVKTSQNPDYSEWIIDNFDSFLGLIERKEDPSIPANMLLFFKNLLAHAPDDARLRTEMLPLVFRLLKNHEHPLHKRTSKENYAIQIRKENAYADPIGDPIILILEHFIAHCPQGEEEDLRKQCLKLDAIPSLSKHLNFFNLPSFSKVLAFLAKSSDGADTLFAEQAKHKDRYEFGIIYRILIFFKGLQERTRLLNDAERVLILMSIGNRFLEKYQEDPHSVLASQEVFSWSSSVVWTLSRRILHATYERSELEAFFNLFFAEKTLIPTLVKSCAFPLFKDLALEFYDLKHHDSTPLSVEETAQVKRHDSASTLLIALIKAALHLKRMDIL